MDWIFFQSNSGATQYFILKKSLIDTLFGYS